ncbi:MAG: single-stranded DNA-binding protein, partial [Psychroserpens sp.]|nr:single-stranded DNA-binding protein [Psychroserpens sp.]
KAKNVAGYRNYDSSEFGKVEALLGGDDEALEALWNKQHSLAELVAPDQFKSYEVLKKRLDQVLGLAAAPAARRPQEDVEDDTEIEMAIEEQIKQAPSFKKPAPAPAPELAAVKGGEEEEDPLAWFQSLSDN